MAVIPIEIISDPICPWCYIGYRTLQRAISLYQKTYPDGSRDTFAISWKPYFIDRVEPEGSVLVHDRMSRRMTGSQITATQTRLKRAGRGVGIDFAFGGYIGSSRLAHRLLYFAGREEGNAQTQCRLAEVLFRYQFELERDISQLDVVVAAAVEVGIGKEAVEGFLVGDEGIREVAEEARQAREERAVSGVPYFVIAGEKSFDGAGDLSEFFEAFVAAREKRRLTVDC
ncbi:thioredoxin-like protein [Aspergillus pseudoustus]|uniref:Thioredoxin-like protein n=1 Tax=Aspergillus pseudoustus TaxID=1810923 RepID=A0ABR4K1I0_9EURO